MCVEVYSMVDTHAVCNAWPVNIRHCPSFGEAWVSMEAGHMSRAKYNPACPMEEGMAS